MLLFTFLHTKHVSVTYFSSYKHLSSPSLAYHPLLLTILLSALNHPCIWAPPPSFLYALRAQLVSTQSLEALEVKEEMEGWGVEGKEREGWMSIELVGWSGAVPPVIIRVTAARARLCAACTRRDVLPREKSEHLSVPPRRQQPPTSLSNSTQLVTRSPNSYFLSLKHTRSKLLRTSFPDLLSASFADSSSLPLSSGRVVKTAGPKCSADCKMECMWYLEWSGIYVNVMQMCIALQNSFSFLNSRCFIHYLHPVLIA